MPLLMRYIVIICSFIAVCRFDDSSVVCRRGCNYSRVFTERYGKPWFLVNKNKTDPLRALNILMRKGMSHTSVSAT